MDELATAELDHLRSLGVTGYKAAAVIERLRQDAGAWKCLTTSPRYQAMTVEDAVTELRRNGMIEEVVPTVLATGHSDDWAHEVTFDATAWFEQASDEELRALHGIGYRGDAPADAVLLYFETRIDELAALLDYCRRSQQGGREGVGFECVVDEHEAMCWLEARRPGLLKEMQADCAYRTDVDGR